VDASTDVDPFNRLNEGECHRMDTATHRPPIGATFPISDGLTLKALLRPMLALLRADGPMSFAELVDAGVSFHAATYDRHDLALLADTTRGHDLIEPVDRTVAEPRWRLTARGERQLGTLASRLAPLLITEARVRCGPANPRYVRRWP
jgi:hypothetical protein